MLTSPSSSPADLARSVKAAARAVGFDYAALAACEPPPHADHLKPWLDAGHHGSMRWLANDPGRRADPRVYWPEARSILTVGISYYQPRPLDAPDPTDPSRGRFARYAWGLDYHDLIPRRLKTLRHAISYLAGREVNAIWTSDTGPLLERPLAAGAGAGFLGKHTLLIRWKQGSYFLLGELLLDLELPPDPPKNVYFGCGGCHRCGDTCPTGALDEPYVNQAERCLSYLTIEHRGWLPPGLRPKLGNWVFGCDLCQDICPYNARLNLETREPHFWPRVPDWGAPKLLDLLALDEAGFRTMFKGSPVKRTKRRGLLRNVCVALGNWGSDEAVGPLATALAEDPEPLIRGHAAWALGRLAVNAPAREALLRAWRREEDGDVRRELDSALGGT